MRKATRHGSERRQLGRPLWVRFPTDERVAAIRAAERRRVTISELIRQAVRRMLDGDAGVPAAGT